MGSSADPDTTIGLCRKLSPKRESIFSAFRGATQFGSALHCTQCKILFTCSSDLKEIDLDLDKSPKSVHNHPWTPKYKCTVLHCILSL